jgi:hypothetical protein
MIIKRRKDGQEIENISITIVQSLAVLKNWHQVVCLFSPSSLSIYFIGSLYSIEIKIISASWQCH